MPPDSAFLTSHQILTNGQREIARPREGGDLFGPTESAFAGAALDRTCAVGMWGKETGNTDLQFEALTQALRLNELV